MAPDIKMANTKEQDLIQRMEKLQIFEDDLIEKFILGSGSGGQKINKTSSCVYLQHIPTGIEIKCQRARSREANRYQARLELCERIEKIHTEKKDQKKMQAEKIRRQTRRPSRTQRGIMLDNKRHLAEKKSRRRKTHHHED